LRQNVARDPRGVFVSDRPPPARIQSRLRCQISAPEIQCHQGESGNGRGECQACRDWAGEYDTVRTEAKRSSEAGIHLPRSLRSGAAACRERTRRDSRKLTLIEAKRRAGSRAARVWSNATLCCHTSTAADATRGTRRSCSRAPQGYVIPSVAESPNRGRTTICCISCELSSQPLSSYPCSALVLPLAVAVVGGCEWFLSPSVVEYFCGAAPRG